MEKSQMMLLAVVMAMCCFSCISCSALVAGIGGSAAPIAQFMDAQNQEGTLQSAGTIREAAERLCQECQAANWEGNIDNPLTESNVPCAELKQNCIDEGLSA